MSLIELERPVRERQQPRQDRDRPGMLTLTQISKQTQIPVRVLCQLVDRAGVSASRYRGTSVYSVDAVLQIVAGLDLPPGTELTTALIRERFKGRRRRHE